MHRGQFQKALNKLMQCQAELKAIQDQIEHLEQIYLHHTWQQGNLVIGWNHKAVGSKPSTKDKIFSLSSVTSNTTTYLQQGITKQMSTQVQQCVKNKKRDRNYSLRKRRKE